MSEKLPAKIEKYSLVNANDMKKMAMVLKAYIVSNKLSVRIVDRDYVMCEGWQFAGGLMGMAARVVKIENLSSSTEKKWRADVEIVQLKNGSVIGSGMAICSNQETKKRTFDEYAICSMAQTRAIGKAYRNMIGWVIKLAGYEVAPAEEMTKVGQDPAQVVATPAPENGTDYKKKLYDEVRRIAKKDKMTADEVLAVINKKTDLKVTKILSQNHAQKLLAQVLQAK